MGVRLVATTFTWADVTFNQPSDVTTINALGNAVEDMHGAWTDYSASFAIQATVTNPTMGNSTVKARYKQIGKTVYHDFWIGLGSTFSPGSGNYRFPLPVAALNADFAAYNGSATILDSGTSQRCATLYSVTPTLAEMMLTVNNSVVGSAGTGTAWAANDVISGSITYEAA